MLDALLWGLIQGLTEFLPISSSGHLVLVPAFLRRAGVVVATPDLAVSAVLHLGTLLAVVTYYRRDLAGLARLSRPESRRILAVLVLGTLPAAAGLPLKATLDRLEDDPHAVAVAMLVTTGLLILGGLLARGGRRLEGAGWLDGLVVGLLQAIALVPGISRSGATIVGGLGRGFEPTEAARLSFLLAVPAVAAAGLTSLPDLAGSGVGAAEMVVGFVVSALSGYLAIAVLIKAIVRLGLGVFAWYTAAVAVAGLVFL
ncbi:MAG: undecaprenyl-diphosphatase [Acidimicrobiia bacterium]|nr:MAG: undecaprenyl-diphosphatase [Acidimicrobiia bacterium]